jgi:hypothetical protein
VSATETIRQQLVEAGYDRLTVPALAKLLSEHGPPVEESTIRDFINQGCPTNDDGTVDLQVYAAWCVRELRGSRAA